MSSYKLPIDLRCREQGARAALYARKGGYLLESYHADRVAIIQAVAAQAAEIERLELFEETVRDEIERAGFPVDAEHSLADRIEELIRYWTDSRAAVAEVIAMDEEAPTNPADIGLIRGLVEQEQAAEIERLRKLVSDVASVAEGALEPKFDGCESHRKTVLSVIADDCKKHLAALGGGGGE